jgi:drug/metabolite transporter (DMT)-like permease
MILSGIVFGLISSLTFGILDILIVSTSRTTGVLQSLLLAQTVSAAILSLCLLQVFISGISLQLFFSLLMVGCLLGAVNTLANWSLYKGLELGPIAVISPISASYGLVTALLALFIFNEALFPLQYIAMVIIFLSLILSSLKVSFKISFKSFKLLGRLAKKKQRVQLISPSDLFLRIQKMRKSQYKGLLFGFISMLCFGIEFFGISIATAHFGPLQPILWSRLCSIFILLIYALCKKNRVWKKVNLKQLGIIALVGILDTAGMIWYDLGTSQGSTSVIAALSSTYTLIPTLAGVIFYHERLPRAQWVWIGLLIIGILLFSLPIH